MFIVLFILAFLIWLVCFYLVFKVSFFAKKIKTRKIIFIGTLIFIVPVLILFISRNYSEFSFVEPIYVLGSILLCTIMYFAISSPVILLLSLFFKKKKSRKIIFYIFLFISVSLSVIGFLELRYTEKITYLNITTNNQNLKGKKYAFFADQQFSIATQVGLAKKITKSLQEIAPEKIFIAGDNFNGEELNWSPLLKEMQNWNNIAPVYVVTGNHESYGNYNEFIDLMKEASWTIISDQTINVDGINILGLNYAFSEKDKENLQNTAIKELSTHQEDIVLVHEPPVDLIDEIAKYSPTLVFSGHTHNGQFWPLNYLVRMKYGKFIYGKNIVNNTTFYTTSGFGISFIADRLFNDPEIVVVNFN